MLQAARSDPEIKHENQLTRDDCANDCDNDANKSDAKGASEEKIAQFQASAKDSCDKDKVHKSALNLDEEDGAVENDDKSVVNQEKDDRIGLQHEEESYCSGIHENGDNILGGVDLDCSAIKEEEDDDGGNGDSCESSTPPPDSQLTINLAPEKYKTSTDGMYPTDQLYPNIKEILF